jgi:hypothetical protein
MSARGAATMHKASAVRRWPKGVGLLSTKILLEKSEMKRCEHTFERLGLQAANHFPLI